MQVKEGKQYKKMTETPVPRLIITLGIPTTISMLVTNIYNLADTYFVGQIGTSASGAVGIVFGLMAIIQAFGFMFGHGAGSIISRKLGEQDTDSATKFASTSFFWSFVVGMLISVSGLVFLNPLMRLLGSTNTILLFARTYGFYILLAAPLMTSSFVMNNILRYEGRASSAMIGLIAGGILNILGDWVFMKKCNMGMEGAGLSTAISQVISFGILLYLFLSGKTQSKISFRFVSKDMGDILKVMNTGFPSLTRQGLSSISTMIMNGQARIYGDAAVAAMTIVNRICFFIFAIGLGIGQGFQPVSAFNYGAKKYSRVKKGFFFTWAAGEIFMAGFAVIGMLLSYRLVGFFRSDPQVILIGTFALRAQLIALFFQPLSVCMNMMLQSVGKNGAATFLSTLRSGLLFIPIIFILSGCIGLTGVEVSQAVSDILTFFIAIPFMVVFFRNLPEDVSENNS
ncbi:MATE family efflux transporter [Anaeromicropila populeti]|uniref:Multidrug export protein MepA n=1 Tax=Anaeromicropila populeti TaxID=37658 RepID=A0A1I6IDV6_9FIRM|nr:MATE family efflux transporter [Anaeromicropila populeti]SFR64876.1 putative efflux protein, MATE family [Anaeromicropila populeti]